mgnify:CR=1 FL=1
MDYNYFLKSKEDLCKNRFASYYLILIKKIESIMDAYSIKHLDGPPDCFSFFTKVRILFLKILKIFDFSYNEKYLLLNSYNKNNIKNILISCIMKEFSVSNLKSLNKFLKLEKILEELIMICHFFELPFTNDFNIDIYKKKRIYINKHNILSNNYVTNKDFLHFVNSNCYSDSTLWSPDGLKWNSSYPKNHPYFWEKTGTTMYIKKFNRYYEIKEVLNQPLENISYYEAEAYCNFMDCELPSIKDLRYLYNRYNITYQKSYLWEWTKNKADTYSDCYGGSYYNNLIINNINDICKYNKSAQHFFTGFRLKKKV